MSAGMVERVVNEWLSINEKEHLKGHCHLHGSQPDMTTAYSG